MKHGKPQVDYNGLQIQVDSQGLKKIQVFANQQGTAVHFTLLSI